MDVYAYNSATTPPAKIELGVIAEQIWTSGFKFSEERKLQVSNPINAAAPVLFDRNTAIENFSFVAGRSFDGVAAIGDALKFMATHAATVPRLAHLEFTTHGQNVWLRNCGITKVELQDKRGALVVFAYTIVGGTWSLS